MHQKVHNILIVDDDPAIRELFGRLLEEEGYRAVLAESGAEALQLVGEQPVDLVLLDVRMPGLNGLDVLESLRRSYSADELPVIMSTGLDGSEEVVEAFEKGANDYISKTCDFPVALARIRTRLRDKSSAAGHAPSAEEIWCGIGPGAVLEDKYRLEEKIGEGHFGVVFRATQVDLERPVAVKMLRTDGSNDSHLRARFQQEGMATCRIEHSNAVTILDFSFTDSGVPYLVMELLEGHSLDEEVRRAGGRLSPARCAELLSPICDVLAEAHELGIVHRDVKPHNVFLHRKRDQETVKVLDFGLATLVRRSGLAVSAQGIGPGTPLYMAPERFCELPYDGRSDVYSLGATLYEMLVGRPPFQSTDGSPLSVARKHLGEPPRPLREHYPEIPDAVDRLVLRALAKSPEERPSAAELGREFAAAAAADSGAPVPLSFATKPPPQPCSASSSASSMGFQTRSVAR